MSNKFLHVKIVTTEMVVFEVDENSKIVTSRSSILRKTTDFGEIRDWLFSLSSHYRKQVQKLLENYRDIVQIECPCDECEDDRLNQRNMTGKQPRR